MGRPTENGLISEAGKLSTVYCMKYKRRGRKKGRKARWMAEVEDDEDEDRKKINCLNYLYSGITPLADVV